MILQAVAVFCLLCIAIGALALGWLAVDEIKYNKRVNK